MSTAVNKRSLKRRQRDNLSRVLGYEFGLNFPLCPAPLASKALGGYIYELEIEVSKLRKEQKRLVEQCGVLSNERDSLLCCLADAEQDAAWWRDAANEAVNCIPASAEQAQLSAAVLTCLGDGALTLADTHPDQQFPSLPPGLSVIEPQLQWPTSSYIEEALGELALICVKPEPFGSEFECPLITVVPTAVHHGSCTAS